MTDRQPDWQAIADSLWVYRRLGWARVRENDREITILSLYVPVACVVVILLAAVFPFLHFGHALWLAEAPMAVGLGVLLVMGGDFRLWRIGKWGEPTTRQSAFLFFRKGRPYKAKGLLLAGKEPWERGRLRRWWPSLSPGVAYIFLVQQNDRTSLLLQLPWSGLDAPEPWGPTEPAVVLARHWAAHLSQPLVIRPAAGMTVDVTHPHRDDKQDIAEIDAEIYRAAQAVLAEESAKQEEEEPFHPHDEPVGELVEIDPELAEKELQEVLPPPAGSEGKDGPPA